MLSEIEQFQKWLRCRVPHGGTHIHYVSDLELFFLWLPKPVATVNVRDVDAFIEHCQAKGMPLPRSIGEWQRCVRSIIFWR